MSFLFGGGRRQPTSAEKIAAMEAEMDAHVDMFKRLLESCTMKCIPKDYHEGELNKGESVCLDRCVSKFLETAMKMNEKIKNDTAQTGASGTGGGMFGF